MGKKCAAVMIVGLMLGGCTSHEPEKPPTAATTSVAPSVRSDDFGLPLVIALDAPEVPTELQGPSPPIKEESATH